MDEWVAIVWRFLGIRWNYVQLVARDVIAHHVATVVADPQIIAAGLPIETNGVANAVSDDVGLATVWV